MNKESKELYEETKRYFTKRVLAHQKLEQNTASLEDCVDAVYAIRESVNYLEQVRKDLEKLSGILQQVTCISLISRHKKSYKTDYCTATKKSSVSYGIPTKKKEPEKYVELMSSLGIPADVIRDELVRVHWPAFKEYCANLQEKGEQPPVGIDPSKGTAHFSLSIRRNRDILSDDINQGQENDRESPF